MPIDQNGGPKMTLKIPAGRYEQSIATLLFVVEIATAVMTIIVFFLWVLLVLDTTDNADIDWYLEILGLTITMALFVILLHSLWDYDRDE